MQYTKTGSKYAAGLSETASRLTRDVHHAVADGGWAAAEAGRLHTWVRAELVPWARSAVRDLEPRQRSVINPYLVQLENLDAQMLGTAGASAADLAYQLRITADRLVARVGTATTNAAKLVPQQRDNVG
ncbi:MAG: hypothetical protein WC054_12850 [Candidatus Nanopelagicales bacterium]